jgi:hypothetical protein
VALINIVFSLPMSMENLQLSNQWLPSPLLLQTKQPDYAHQMKSA